ncbi:50S ribosomal protein L18 [Candidatus Woesearchaeota archaeon]|nr:50S ribosomal protein L18 [Candidatus Woesearchaeota archaeon]
MTNSKRYNVPLRRKREGKTNYKKRLKMLKSEKPRLVIRTSLNRITAQIIEYRTKGDKIVAYASSRELEKKGWKHNKSNIPAAYLTGLLAGKKAVEVGVKEAILDTGLNHPTRGSRIFACLKGAVDAGLEVPHKKDIFPSEERIKGEHIAKFNKKSSEITKTFEEVKNNIKVKE